MATADTLPDTDPLAPLIAGIKRQDQAAFEQLYEFTADRLYGLSLRIVRNPQDAEDILSDVYLKVWQEPQRYDPARGSVLAWLLIMCRSRALDGLRKHKYAPCVPLDSEVDDPVEPGPSPAEMLQQWQEGSRVQQALAQLNEVQRQLIQLAFFEGLSHGQIATRTGLPLGTVKSHLRRAQQSLEVLLEDIAPELVCQQPG